ncbi:hypothetical protein Tco_0904704 [Tanacetum coccineum]
MRSQTNIRLSIHASPRKKGRPQKEKIVSHPEGDETINHLMLHYDLARDVWALVGRWWSIGFPSVLTIRELMSWVDDTRLHTLAKKVLHVVVGTTTWNI